MVQGRLLKFVKKKTKLAKSNIFWFLKAFFFHEKMPLRVIFTHFSKQKKKRQLTLVITVTLAPKSAKTRPQNGTGARPESSTTLIPSSGR